MANIMQQNSDDNRLLFYFRNLVPFIAQRFDGHTHQVHSAQCMVKTGMQRAGVNQVCHAQLFDVSQPLKIWVLYQVENQVGGDADEAVNRVVYYFLFIQNVVLQAKMANKGNKPVGYLLIFVNVTYYP